MVGAMFGAKVLLFCCCVTGGGAVGLEALFPAFTGGIEKLWLVRNGGDTFIGEMVGIEFNGRDWFAGRFGSAVLCGGPRGVEPMGMGGCV